MNWTRALMAGIAGGVIVNMYDWLVHGFVMADTYAKYPIFAVEPANPLLFTLVAVVVGIFGAMLFACTRGSWADGMKGGLAFGLAVGLVFFFAGFYNTLVLNGFPYYLSWCWGGINLIGWLLYGAVFALVYKPKAAA